MKKLVLAAMAALLLAGCETATPYAPVAAGHGHQGYSETRVAQDRWRVSFSGNSVTPRDTVEIYLLYRAAELTTEQGYDWFETAQRSTEKRTTFVGSPDPWGYGPFWRPSWRYYRRGYWGPWGDPFWGDYDVEQIDRFQATAEIVMHHGKKPEGDKHAFDAREVMTNLGPKVVRPQPKS